MKFSYQFDENVIPPLRHKQLMNRILRSIGHLHKDTTLPKHFVEGAENVYHYRRRRAKYVAKKLALYHHKKPLVLTGTLLAYLMAKSKVTATDSRWRLYCKAPFPMPDWMRAEIEKINKNEVRSYMRKLAKDYVTLLPQYRRKRKRKGSA